MSQTASSEDRQPFWFLVLFAVAIGGGAVAYVPLLTVLLPLKVTTLIGTEDVPALAQVTFYGAIIASLANIAFGMLSDRSRMRIPWIVAGLICSSFLLVLIGEASSLSELIILVMAWQIGLNMMLSPLLAWAGDCVPDSQKGVLGGLLAIAPAMGGVAGSIVTFERIVPPDYRLVTVAFIVAATILPLILLGKGRAQASLTRHVEITHEYAEEKKRARSVVTRMWLARFLVQIAEAGLFAFLLFWLRSIVADFHENTAANIFSLVLLLSIPLSLLIGRWSDKWHRPITPLVACSAFSALGLTIMAAANELNLAMAGYVVFGVSASIFLSLHTSQTLRVLPLPQHRGRDLGVFNLTNTIPSIVMPWLTLTLVPSFGFAALFLFFAALALLAAGLLATHTKRL